MQRFPVHGLDPASGADGQVPVIAGGKFVIGDPAGGLGARVNNHTDLVRPLGPFTKRGVVLTPGPAGAWDAAMVESACPVWVPEVQEYALLYTGYAGTTAAPTSPQLGIAWSLTPEGPYTKETAPILGGTGVAGDPDQSGVTGCIALRHADDGSWTIYSIGTNAGGYEGGAPTLCRYSTPSLAQGSRAFTRHGAAVNPGAAPWCQTKTWIGSVVEDAGTWHLYINGTATDGHERIGHGSAPTMDGPWTMDAAPEIDVGPAGSWDSQFVGQPWVFRLGETWYMEYYGNKTSGISCDGLATTSAAAFPHGWTKHPANPLLVPSETYDALHAHKPLSLVLPDRICHFYTAVANDNTRQVALAVIGRTQPAAGLTVQDENGTIATAVTQFDFRGAGITAADGAGEVVVTVTGATSSGGTEQLVQDGASNPPVVLTNEAADDLLYQG